MYERRMIKATRRKIKILSQRLGKWVVLKETTPAYMEWGTDGNLEPRNESVEHGEMVQLTGKVRNDLVGVLIGSNTKGVEVFVDPNALALV